MDCHGNMGFEWFKSRFCCRLACRQVSLEFGNEVQLEALKKNIAFPILGGFKVETLKVSSHFEGHFAIFVLSFWRFSECPTEVCWMISSVSETGGIPERVTPAEGANFFWRRFAKKFCAGDDCFVVLCLVIRSGR